MIAVNWLNMTGSSVVMVVAAIILLVWECLAFGFGKRRALLSTWFQKLGFRAPAAVFILGMLAGHFWLYFPPTLDDERVICPKCRETLRFNVDMKTGDLTADLIDMK